MAPPAQVEWQHHSQDLYMAETCSGTWFTRVCVHACEGRGRECEGQKVLTPYAHSCVHPCARDKCHSLVLHASLSTASTCHSLVTLNCLHVSLSRASTCPYLVGGGYMYSRPRIAPEPPCFAVCSRPPARTPADCCVPAHMRTRCASECDM